MHEEERVLVYPERLPATPAPCDLSRSRSKYDTDNDCQISVSMRLGSIRFIAGH